MALDSGDHTNDENTSIKKTVSFGRNKNSAHKISKWITPDPNLTEQPSAFNIFYTAIINQDNEDIQTLSELQYSLFKVKKNSHTLFSLLACEGKHNAINWLLANYCLQLENKSPYVQIATGYAMGGYFKNDETIVQTLCEIEDDDCRKKIIQEACNLLNIPDVIQVPQLNKVIQLLRSMKSKAPHEHANQIINATVKKLREQVVIENRNKAYRNFGMFAMAAITLTVGTVALVMECGF